MDFYLGADVAGLQWGVPVMVSHGRLRVRRTLPRATAPWVCDSRGYTELAEHGRWTIGARAYAEALTRYATEVGQLAWAAPQDWMCTPDILARTGLTVREHQQRTVESVLLLRLLLGGRVHVIPMLQGWTLADYLAHVRMYAGHGVDLLAEPVVGIGSIAARQADPEVAATVKALAATGLRLHGFGAKTEAMDLYGQLLASADSFSWSAAMRRRVGHCGHGLSAWAQNCPACAAQWRDEVLRRLDRSTPQPALDLFGAAA